MLESLAEQFPGKIRFHEEGPVWVSIKFDDGIVNLTWSLQERIGTSTLEGPEFRRMIHIIIEDCRAYMQAVLARKKPKPLSAGKFGQVIELSVSEEDNIVIAIKEDGNKDSPLERRDVLQGYINESSSFPKDTIRLVEYYATVTLPKGEMFDYNTDTSVPAKKMPIYRYILMEQIGKGVSLKELKEFSLTESEPSACDLAERLIITGIITPVSGEGVSEQDVRQWAKERQDEVEKAFADLRKEADGDPGAYPHDMKPKNIVPSIEIHEGKAVAVFVMVDL